MNGIDFHQELTMSVGRSRNQGELTLCDVRLPYSATALLRGEGMGTNPEELLISAMGACFSRALAALLSARQLPAESLKVAVDGVVVQEPALEFRSLTVNLTVYGAVQGRAKEYRQAAETALNHCFIGGLISHKVACRIGELTLATAAVEQPYVPGLLRAAWLPPQHVAPGKTGSLAARR